MEVSNTTLLTVSQVAKMLNVSRMTVYRWIEKGELKHYQIVGTIRVDIVDVNKLLEKGYR